jgi:hypothetical protein
MISAPKRIGPVSDQGVELGPLKNAAAALAGLGIILMLLMMAHAASLWVRCLEVGTRIARRSAPLVLYLGLFAQVLWLGALAREAVALLF